ncbi:MAG: rRNA maturation RNase YbeY [Elainella sp. Prado103]|jgi:probable rRNA maturation factor|nr:rRNA maturation RNase YbeY [Elainella sp. Prado103]
MALPLQVEVNIQDCFFASVPKATTVHITVEQPALNPDPVCPDPTATIALSPDRPPAPIPVPTWQHWFNCWLEQMAADLPSRSDQVITRYELSLRLTDDREIQQLNAQYRQKDQPTDVLAFAALEVETPPIEDLPIDFPLYLGDIVISVETAQQQANQQEHTLQQELAWLAAHAWLHLLGWDHPDQASLEAMLQQQTILLQTIGLTSSYDSGEN